MDCSEIKRGPSPEKTVSATGSVPMREQLSARVSRACEKLAALPELEVRPFILKGDKIGDDSCSWEEGGDRSSASSLLDRASQEERELRKIRDAIRDDRLTSE